MSKHMRLPNGFGQITKISGRRLRKPYRAMVSVGKKDNGRPIVKPLKPEAYFETYNDAYYALMEFHKNPYDLDVDTTLESLYERWSEEKYKKIKNSKYYKTAWNKFDGLKNINVRDLRARHIKGYIENYDTTDGNKRIMLLLINQIMDYAVEYELIQKNYSRDVHLDTAPIVEEHHTSFTDEEFNKFKNNMNDPISLMVVVQCLTGFRPQELCNLRIENINLEERYIIGGMKTESGTDRKVPIHNFLYDLICEKYQQSIDTGSQYLFQNSRGNRIEYESYRRGFKKTLSVLKISAEHTLHDCRVHFVSLAKKYKVDEFAIKRIVGHSISDITESVYTVRESDWLLSEINKISV